MNILQVKKFLITPFNQSQVIKQATFTYSLLGKAFEKQIKTPEDFFFKKRVETLKVLKSVKHQQKQKPIR